MKKLIFGAVFMALSNFANAGFLVDAWKTGAPEEVCRWAADQVGYSISRRLVDVPFVFKDKDDLPPTYDRNRIPRDALYITSWSKLDDEDRAFLVKFIRLGYDIAEMKLKQNPAARFPDDFGDDYNKFMAACMTHKNNQEEIFRLIEAGSAAPKTQKQVTEEVLGDLVNDLAVDLAASSESIRGVPIGQEQKVGINEKLLLCSELRYDINLIARAISEGEPMENMIDLAKKSEQDLRPDRLERILRQIPEAYGYKGPIYEWMEKEYKDCMQ